MESVYNIKVDCNSAISNQTGIVLKRGDSGITLAIEVSGLTPGTADASIVFARPTGVVESTDLTRNNNVWSYIIKGTELEHIGKVVADIKFRDDENRISTASFTFYVAEDTLEGAADEPHSYSDTIAQIAERLEGEVDGLTEEVEALSQTVSEAEGRIGEAEGRISEVEADVAEIAESIPTKLSELEDDATHRTVTDAEKTAWDNKSDFSGDYDDLENKPTIPSKTSDLNNDSNFVSDADYTHTDNNYDDDDKAAVGEISGIKQDLTQLDSDLTALTTVVNGKANQSNVDALTGRVSQLESNAISLDRRVTNLEYASRGVLYREETNTTAAYSKALDADVMPWGQLNSIGGKSVVWNQLFDSNHITATRGTYTFSNNEYEFTVTDTGQTQFGVLGYCTLINGHKYFATAEALSEQSGNYGMYHGGVVPINSFNITEPNVWVKKNVIRTATSETTTGNFYFYPYGVGSASVIGDKFKFRNMYYVDLTQMYGAGNEPSSISDPRIAEIEAYATLHPEYNSGEIVSAKVDKVVSTSASDVLIANYPIPSEVQALDGYGESNGTKINYINYSEKKFIAYGHYVDGSWVDFAEAIQTDISAYLTDNIINVEGSGKLTFHQNGTEFVVPNSEIFLIKTGG